MSARLPPLTVTLPTPGASSAGSSSLSQSSAGSSLNFFKDIPPFRY